MKSCIIILINLLFIYNSAQAGFVEKFRSEPNRRFAKTLQNLLTDNHLSYRDLNDNGLADRPILVSNDNGDIILVVFDGLSRTPLWRFPLSQKLGISDLNSLRFINFNDDPKFLLINVLCTNENINGTLDFWIIDPNTNEVEYSAKNTRILGAIDVDKDTLPDFIYLDISMREIVVVGWSDNNNGNVSARNIKIDKDNFNPLDKIEAGYSLKLKYESNPQTELLYDDSYFETANDFDVDNDSVMDLVLMPEDQNQNATGIVVRDGITHDIKWSFQFPQEQLSEFSNFHGFFDVDGDGQKEALFGQRTVVALDKTIFSLDANFEIQAIYDVDNDGYPDLVGIGLQDSTVQVWGKESATEVTEKDLIASGFQLKQNYPNPFNPSTTISFSIAKAGEAVLSIYNILGQKVRTLISQYKPSGNYTITWNGRNDAGIALSSGRYFYQLKVGALRQTRGMMLLK